MAIDFTFRWFQIFGNWILNTIEAANNNWFNLFFNKSYMGKPLTLSWPKINMTPSYINIKTNMSYDTINVANPRQNYLPTIQFSSFYFLLASKFLLFLI